jgi:methyl-accepting chemotaxis protein-2 (aspartate sensor receptor)
LPAFHFCFIDHLHNMSLTITNLKNLNVGGKITVFTFGLLSAMLAIILSLINLSTARMLERRAQANVADTLNGISNTVEVFHSAMTDEASRFARIFASHFAQGQFTLDAASTVEIAGKPTPTLQFGGKALNLDFSLPDKFTADTGVVATIFAAQGEDFVRVSTSLKKENGERAVGTQLDHSHRATLCCARAIAIAVWPRCSASSTSPSTIPSKMAAAR